MPYADPTIPLQAQPAQFMTPAQQISLQEMVMRNRELQRQIQEQAALRSIYATPGNFESGLVTEQGLKALAPYPAARDQALKMREGAIDLMGKEAARRAEELERLNKARKQDLDEIYRNGYSTYLNADGDEQTKRHAMSAAINEGIDGLVNSGKAKQYGLDPQTIQGLRGLNDPNMILNKLLSPKEVTERASMSAAEKAAQGAMTGEGVPLSAVGKPQGPTDAVTGRPVPESVDPTSGAVVRGLDLTPPEGREIGPTDEPPPAGTVTREGEKVEVEAPGVPVEIRKGGKEGRERPAISEEDDPEDLRAQAKKYDKAAQAAMAQGTSRRKGR